LNRIARDHHPGTFGQSRTGFIRSTTIITAASAATRPVTDKPRMRT
jgi:hypothetical protein